MFRICILICLFFFTFKLYAFNSNIDIKFKIGDEIITNIDIQDEENYLIFLRPKLSSLPKKELIKISENSLIKEIIKKKELKRVFKNIEDKGLKEDIKKSIFNYKNVKNEEEFINLTKEKNINYEKILEKIKFEGLWNEFIFRKYNNLVKIDKTLLKEELIKNISNKKKYEYELSEILFEINSNEKFETKYKNILEYIKNNDFKSAASKFSLSNSVNRGGEIGWVKETLLSEKIVNKLKNLKKGQISNPIKYPNGYLLLKVNNKKEMKQTIDIDKELNEKVNFERNKQLNQFSMLYYKKLEQNTKINEY